MDKRYGQTSKNQRKATPVPNTSKTSDGLWTLHVTSPESRHVPFKAIVSHLLDRVDPHKPSLDRETQEMQQLCGQWIAWRRLCLGLGSQAVHEATGIDAPSLILVETGLGDVTPIDTAARTRLVSLLANNGDHETPYPPTWVSSIIDIALGHTIGADRGTARRIVEDIQASTNIPTQGRKSVGGG